MRYGVKRLNQAGFTLLEVMITLLLAVALVASLLFASLGTRHSVRMAMIQSQALMLARTYVERIRATDYDDVEDDTVNNVTISNNATASTADDVKGTVTTDVTDNGNSTKTVLVTVTWTGKALGANTNRQVSLSTLVSDYDAAGS